MSRKCIYSGCAVIFVFVPQIDNEEYGEALSLAHAYNLDSDLVYQRQWRKSTVSVASIQDYLVRAYSHRIRQSSRKTLPRSVLNGDS